jgi:hypothetical protein
MDRDADATPCQHLSRHQPGRAGADDGDLGFGSASHKLGLRHSGTRVFAWTRNLEIPASMLRIALE